MDWSDTYCFFSPAHFFSTSYEALAIRDTKSRSAQHCRGGSGGEPGWRSVITVRAGRTRQSGRREDGLCNQTRNALGAQEASYLWCLVWFTLIIVPYWKLILAAHQTIASTVLVIKTRKTCGLLLNESIPQRTIPPIKRLNFHTRYENWISFFS